MTERMDGRTLRLKTLGNAVCPPQAYPIFHYIAAIRPAPVPVSVPMERQVTTDEGIKSAR